MLKMNGLFHQTAKHRRHRWGKPVSVRPAKQFSLRNGLGGHFRTCCDFSHRPSQSCLINFSQSHLGTSRQAEGMALQFRRATTPCALAT